MTPEQKLKVAIIKLAMSKEWITAEEFDPEQVDEVWERLSEEDGLADATNEFRESGEPTKLPSDFSRHYESDAVAAKMFDGTWVGWTYWHGGGKHSEPGAIEWMEHAYPVDCKEQEKLMTVRTFTKGL